MNIAARAVPASPVLARLRAATGELHQHIETRLDIVERLADPARRTDAIRRFATLHDGAAVLAPWLAFVPGLPIRRRRSGFASGEPEPTPEFPAPGGTAEALGMHYVLEGSALGGRLILRRLADRGITDPRLAFLDPYGAETGARWRGLLAVLERALTDEPAIDAACRGAVRAFHQAARVLAET